MPPTADQKKRAAAVRKRLTRAMPSPESELRFDDPWQLLVVTILSAQSTDKTVNRVAPDLFARYPNPQALGAARRASVERLVKPTGFFRNKAKAIVGASKQLVERHQGQVPKSMEDLCQLPGVARKTANVVLGTAYGIASGITVDTHAGRVARHLDLTAEKDPTKVERDLCALLPARSWVDMGHRLVLHGRYICQSRRPQCAPCPLNELCPAAAEEPTGRWTQRADQE
ncbi:MAG: endonuclease III, partial [Deltaproteobacteria bacterium]|nr:endonuclease III [Deltaproteobacteria bacterium]